MANLSKIVITFLTDAVDGQYISIARANQETFEAIFERETFINSFRTGSGIIGYAGVVSANPGETTATNFAQFFDLDYNSSRVMTITRVLNVVTIEILDPWEITLNFASVGLVSVVETARVPNTFTITSATLSNNTAPCDFVDVTITTSIQADSYFMGRGELILVTTNPFTVSVPRTNQSKIMVNGGGITLDVAQVVNGDPWFYFNEVYVDNIEVAVDTDVLSGATVTINVTYPSQQEQLPTGYSALEYSLDNVTFVSSNVFSGQAEGDYTIYVKDAFGCTVSKDYTVNATAGREPYFFISNINSLGFSKNETWNGNQDGIHKNSQNTLSGVDLGRISYVQNDIFRNEDNIKIQFKSNYQDHIIHVENCSGQEITNINLNIEATRMSTNLNLFESLDCTAYIREGGNLGIYFTSGDTYDINGATIPGGGYTLQGNLPDSAIIGNSIFIQVERPPDPLNPGTFYYYNGIYVIENIFYDRDVNKRVIAINTNANILAGDTLGLMRAYYDIIPFEVYEFDIDFANIMQYLPTFGQGSERTIRFRIEVQDDVYQNLDYYTEYIDVLNESTYTQSRGLENLLAINYYGDNNRSIFYLYGISHFIRAEVLSLENTVIDESEAQIGDLKTYLSRSTVNQGLIIRFAEVTERVKIKILLALSSKYLFINTVGYVKNSAFEVELIQGTNLYTITATLIQSGKNFNINISTRTGNTGSYKNSYIPRIITTNLGDNIKTG